MLKKTNLALRQFMVIYVRLYGPMASAVLVRDTKRAFPKTSSKQIAGNLSSVCCYFNNLNYNGGIVS